LTRHIDPMDTHPVASSPNEIVKAGEVSLPRW